MEENRSGGKEKRRKERKTRRRGRKRGHREEGDIEGRNDNLGKRKKEDRERKGILRKETTTWSNRR